MVVSTATASFMQKEKQPTVCVCVCELWNAALYSHKVQVSDAISGQRSRLMFAWLCTTEWVHQYIYRSNKSTQLSKHYEIQYFTGERSPEMEESPT